jgi:hypothetical protein
MCKQAEKINGLSFTATSLGPHCSTFMDLGSKIDSRHLNVHKKREASYYIYIYIYSVTFVKILKNFHINWRKQERKVTHDCHYEKTRLKYPST